MVQKADGSFTTEAGFTDGDNYLQWGSGGLVDTGDHQTFRCTLNTNNNMGYNTLNSIQSFLERNSAGLAGCTFTLCIEQQGTDFFDTVGVIDNITTTDLKSGLHATNGGARCFTAVDLSALDYVTVTGVETTEKNNVLKVTFSEPVVLNANGTQAEYWLRIMNENEELMWAVGDGTYGVAETGTPLQWKGVLTQTEDPCVYNWTMASGGGAFGYYSIAPVYDYLNANSTGLAGCTVALCFEQQIPSDTVNYADLIDNITSSDGSKTLAATNLSRGGFRCFIEVANNISSDSITVESVVATANDTVLVTFSEEVTNTLYNESAGGYVALRLVDENDNLMFVKKDNTLTIVEADGTPVQFSGQFKPTEDASVWEFVTDGADISYLLDATKPDGRWAGYQFKFCIEQQLNAQAENASGYVDNFTSLDGLRMLEGESVLWDRNYSPISIDYADPYFDTIHLQSAKAVSESVALLQFSEPIEFAGDYFTAIRLVSEGNYLGWTGEENNSTPLQFTGYLTYADENDHSKVYFVLNGGQEFGVKTIQDVIEMNGQLEQYRGTYTAAICIEEKNCPATSGLVESIVGENNANKILEAENFFRIGYLDGAYVPVTSDLTLSSLFVESVTAINDLQLVVKFNQAIDLNAENATFMAVRLVDDDNNLLWDGKVNESTAMQWTGDWTWNNDAHTEILWTINGGNTYGASNLREVLNKEGELEAFKDAKVAFCIEELPPNIFGDSGYIDNITTKGNSVNHLAGNKLGGYDGVYTDITVGFDLDPLTYYATAINDMQLYIQFSDSVEITGSPFMAIRYIAGDNALLWSDGEGTSVPYQFAGSWEWANNSHTAIIWTMNGSNTCLANSITDVYNYVNGLCVKEGCSIKMCIEELPADGFAVHSFDNLIHNIVSADGQRHLSANKSGGYDGSYKYISIDYDTESTLEITKIISKTDTTINITFNKPVEISDEVSMGLCFVDANGTVAIGMDARDMKYKGTWKYVNDDKTEIEWTIKDGVGTISDMLGYQGDYAYYANQGLFLKFYIQEHEGCHGYNKLVEDVTTDEGTVHLLATNYADQDIFITDLNTEYEVAVAADTEPVEETEPEVIEVEKEIENYKVIYIISSVFAAFGLILGIIIGFVKKSKKK